MGTTTFAVDLKFGVVVVRDVPAFVCQIRGDAWIDDPVARSSRPSLPRLAANRPSSK